MLQKPRLLYLTAVICFFVSGLAQAQTGLPRPRITARVNESQLQTLRNNVHPLARPEFEEGTVAPDSPMQRMLLVLSRSADQENALEQLLKDQQDPASSRYHQWLTPEQFGQQFGVADADMPVPRPRLIAPIETPVFPASCAVTSGGTVETAGVQTLPVAATDRVVTLLTKLLAITTTGTKHPVTPSGIVKRITSHAAIPCGTR